MLARMFAKGEIGSMLKEHKTTLVVNACLVLLQVVLYHTLWSRHTELFYAVPHVQDQTGSALEHNAGLPVDALLSTYWQDMQPGASVLGPGVSPTAAEAQDYRINVASAMKGKFSPKKWRQAGDGRQARPKTLLSIHTSVSYWHITELMLISLAANTQDDFDVIIVDDSSQRINIEEKAEELGVKVLHHSGKEPKGNTYTWNLAWTYFMQHPEYTTLIVCNNDLLVPTGTITKLAQAMAAGWAWLLPMTTQRGTWYKYHRLQDAFTDIPTDHCDGPNKGNAASKVPGCASDWTDQSIYFQEVQDILDQTEPQNGADVIIEAHPKDVLNGYMMAFNKNIMTKFQHDKKNFLLFDPNNVNTGNEAALGESMKKAGERRLGIHRGCFVYHFKGYTLWSSEKKVGGKTDRSAVDESVYSQKD